IQKIEEGWSHDLKYFLQDKEENKYLLRVSKLGDFIEQASLYQSFQNLPTHPDLLPSLISQGQFSSYTYRLFSWLEGLPALEKIEQFAPKKQYSLGLQAGQLLKVIHTASISEKNLDHWLAFYQNKIDRKIELYANCSLKYKKGEAILDFIKNTRHLLTDHKQCFLHGDYHIGNMLITPNEKIAIIDFNRLEYGDPWSEFNRINWTAQASPAMAKGQIDAYFDHDVPDEFHLSVALFIAVNQIGALPWAMNYSQKDVDTIIKQTEEILVWYDDFQGIIPSWYA
ncbi:MAG: phosphotransferase, partial [Bacteroidota bacterium]